MSEEMTFEQAMVRLGEIVSQLENGDISLDDSLARYQEGVKLSQFCKEKLTKAEETLTKSMTASGEEEVFEGGQA